MVYITRGLLDALLGFAREREPEAVSVPLAVTPASEFDTDLGLDPETPVFTHFYLPDAGSSVSAVFGVDLATPAGRTPGRFVSHPQGRLEVSRTDDLREVVFVSVPPWDDGSVAAFTRSGARQPLSVLDAEPPTESL